MPKRGNPTAPEGHIEHTQKGDTIEPMRDNCQEPRKAQCPIEGIDKGLGTDKPRA